MPAVMPASREDGWLGANISGAPSRKSAGRASLYPTCSMCSRTLICRRVTLTAITHAGLADVRDENRAPCAAFGSTVKSIGRPSRTRERHCPQGPPSGTPTPHSILVDKYLKWWQPAGPAARSRLFVKFLRRLTHHVLQGHKPSIQHRMGYIFPKASSVGASFLLGALIASYSAFVRQPRPQVWTAGKLHNHVVLATPYRAVLPKRQAGSADWGCTSHVPTSCWFTTSPLFPPNLARVATNVEPSFDVVSHLGRCPVPDQGIYVTRPCSTDQPVSTRQEFWQQAVCSVSPKQSAFDS